MLLSRRQLELELEEEELLRDVEDELAESVEGEQELLRAGAGPGGGGANAAAEITGAVFRRRRLAGGGLAPLQAILFLQALLGGN